MKNKTALITGILGMTASYLCEILLNKGYKVVGLRRRSSNPNYENLENVINHPNLELVIGDITDYSSVHSIMTKYNFNEIYNLAAQSFVRSSFETPFHTIEVNSTGPLNFLEVIRKEKLDCKFYQASTSELFGKSVSLYYDVQGSSVRYDGLPVEKDCFIWQNRNSEYFQDEDTPLTPASPYGVGKLSAHHLCRLYRESYNLFTSCGILFNHEGPRRGKDFVTRKITDYVGQLVNGKNNGKLKLGNLSASRDFGFAGDYANAQYLMLQQEKPDDYVVCTGETHTVREFCETAFDEAGFNYEDWVEVDPEFYRPAEVDYLRGDCSKAKQVLGWKPEYTFKQLVSEMVQADIERYKC